MVKELEVVHIFCITPEYLLNQMFSYTLIFQSRNKIIIDIYLCFLSQVVAKKSASWVVSVHVRFYV